MSDADAAYYQAHRDDPGEWDEPEQPPVVARRRLGAVVSVRISAEEESLLRGVATERRLSLSAFMRDAALASAGQPRGVDPAELAGRLEDVARELRAASRH